MRGEISYESDGIYVCVSKEINAVEYVDANNVQRTRFETSQGVNVDFLGYKLESGNLTELCFAKSCVQYFVQSAWRSKSKKGLMTIDLNEVIQRDKLILGMAARQKNMKHYLQVARVNNSTGEQQDVYLSVRQAMMLDMALSKAMNSMTPQANDSKQERYEDEPSTSMRDSNPRLSAYLQKCWDEC